MSIDIEVYRRMEDLPEPFGTDMIPRGIEPFDYWWCRYCGDGEAKLGITPEAESTRALAHQRFCPKRPKHDIPDRRETEAAVRLFGNDYRREIATCDAMISDERKALRRTWWPPIRRQIRSRIIDYRKRRRVAISGLAAISVGIDPRTRRLNEYGRPMGISEERP